MVARRVAKSSAETEAQRQRVNADRSIEYRVRLDCSDSHPATGTALESSKN